jgi:putative spermidine/putrescine transport system substrate-binding protein
MRGPTRSAPLLLTALLVVCLGCPASEEPSSPDAAETTTASEALTVASFGGAWQDAQRQAMFEPFAAQSGVEVTDVEYDGSYDAIRENGGSGQWDVIDVEPVELLRGAAEGIYEPLDWSPEERETLSEGAVHSHGVALMTWAVVMGFDATDMDSADVGPAGPSDWRDFWNLERFPGQRALRSTPEWMLEIALLADGVAPEALYPLDLDRAFESLAKIEGSVVFFDTWAEPVDLLASRDAAFAVGTNGRLAAAREAGNAIGMSWRQGLVSSDYFVIPAGSEAKARARELVRYAVGEEAQAAFPRLIDYGPIHSRAIEALPDEVRERLPSQHMDQLIPFDAQWWLEHEDEAHRRYDEWMAELGTS